MDAASLVLATLALATLPVRALDFDLDFSGCIALSWPGNTGLEQMMLAADDRPRHELKAVPADASRSVPFSELAGRVVEDMLPGPGLAGWVSRAEAGYLGGFELAGVAAACRRLASWATAAELTAVAEMTARTAARDSAVPVETDGRPGSVSPEAAAEVGLALTMSQFGAALWADLAVNLRWRLPGTLSALSEGRIDLSRARLIAELTSVLDDDDARTVEERILKQAGQQTTGQLRAALRRAVITVDPGAAERRREEAERRARVGLYADQEGTATISGHNLPGIQACAAMARITALAQAMKAAGADGGIDILRAQVLIGLLLNTLPGIPPPLEDPAAPGPVDPGQGGPHSNGADDPPDHDPHDPPNNDPDNPPDDAPGGSPDHDPDDPPNNHPDDLPNRDPDDPPDRGPGDRRVDTDDRNPPDADSESQPEVNRESPQSGGNPHDSDRKSPQSGGNPHDSDHESPQDGRSPQDNRTEPTDPNTGLQGLDDPPGGRKHSPADADGSELIVARDQTCRLPGCRQPAWQSDLDHTVPFDDGGLTCRCNVGSVCRTHHRLKQRPGWHLEQRQPGIFEWTTPAGRRHLVAPDPHPF